MKYTWGEIVPVGLVVLCLGGLTKCAVDTRRNANDRRALYRELDNKYPYISDPTNADWMIYQEIKNLNPKEYRRLGFHKRSRHEIEIEMRILSVSEAFEKAKKEGRSFKTQ
jgi:hypothetical protein